MPRPWANGSEARFRSCGRQPRIVVSRVTTSAPASIASARPIRLSTSALVDAPVELHPPVRRPHRLGELLHRGAALVGVDVGHAHCGRCPGDVEVAVGVDHLAGADRGEQHRCLQLPPEQLDGEVALGDAVGHPRHDLPPVEGGPVVAHRLPLAGSPGDVRPADLGAGPARSALELLEVRRHGRTPAEHPGAVDLGLPLPPRPGRVRRALAGLRHGASLGARGAHVTRCRGRCATRSTACSAAITPRYMLSRADPPGRTRGAGWGAGASGRGGVRRGGRGGGRCGRSGGSGVRAGRPRAGRGSRGHAAASRRW